MTDSSDTSIAARVRAVEEDYRRRMSRMLVTFALVEGPVLLALVLLVFVAEIVDPEIGVWLLIGAALVGGALLSTLMLRLVQARTRAVAQARGENPLF